MRQTIVIWTIAAIASFFVFTSVKALSIDTTRNVASIYMSLHGGGL